jgi:hypothetical protein|nr:MAG TPA: hypothetical protein [Caudoviricetes sp.]
MEKTEYKVGETFQFGLKTLKCVEGNGNYCANCFLQQFAEYGCDFLIDYVVGYCSKLLRTDDNDVIFIEVEETDKQE